jgi:hypothetical protein
MYYRSNSSLPPTTAPDLTASTAATPALPTGWSWNVPSWSNTNPWIHRASSIKTTTIITQADEEPEYTYQWGASSEVIRYSYKGNTNSAILKRVSVFDELTNNGAM